MPVVFLSNPLINLFTPFDLMSWWYYASGGEKALIVVGIIAMALLVIIIASPYVKPLQFITTRLGLVQERVIYIAVPVNHTVYVNRTIIEYVNQTVPVYINRIVAPVNGSFVVVGNGSLSLLESVTGRCAGDLVVLPNGTTWFVYIWLVPRNYLLSNPLLYPTPYNGFSVVYYNSTTHYAQLAASEFTFFYGLYPMPMGFYKYGVCFLDNVTINGYYVMVCGDTIGNGPMSFGPVSMVNVSGTYYEVIEPGWGAVVHPMFVGSQVIDITQHNYNTTLMIPEVNTTYTGIIIYYNGINLGPAYAPSNYVTLGPVCNITVTYAPNPQAALYIELPLEYVKYFNESVIPIYGSAGPYGKYIGYYVWRSPS